MTSTVDVSTAPLPPKVRGMSLGERLDGLRNYHRGQIAFREHGGRVTQVPIGPGAVIPRFVVIMSPQGMHDVLALRNGETDKDLPPVQETRHFGRSVFNLLHEEWVPRRRTLQPIFTKKHVSSYARHMAAAAEATAAAALAEGHVALDPMTRRLTLEVLGASVLGMDLGEKAQTLGPLIHDVLEFASSRGTAPLRLPVAIPTPAVRAFRRNALALNVVIDEAIERCRSNGNHDAELIRLLIESKDPETGAELTNEEIRGELVTFLIAGHDTTSTTIAYALWQLGRNPHMQDLVADEVLALGDRPISHEDVSALPYTVQVLHEALRLCPPGAATGRNARKDLLVDGFRVPRGSAMMLGIFAMHRDPAYWENAETFDPSRFSSEKSAGRDRWQYLPFGGGPRSCIGDHFAMLEATIAVATIIRAARIDSLEPDFPMAVPFTLTAAGPIPARITRR